MFRFHIAFLLLAHAVQGELSLIELNLSPSWPRTSIFQEVIEFVGELSHEDVEKALNLFTSVDDSYSPEVLLGNLNQSLFSSPYTGALLDLSVANKLFAARIEFQRSLERRLSIDLPSPSCSSTYAVVCLRDHLNRFFIKRLCSAEEYSTLDLNSLSWGQSRLVVSCQLFRSDHILRQNFLIERSLNSESSLESPPTPFLVIYSPLATKHDRVTVVQFLAVVNKVLPVIFRHSDSPECRSPSVDPREFCLRNDCCRDSLASHGVELVVKSDEYRTHDDTPVATQLLMPHKATEVDIEDEAEEILGISKDESVEGAIIELSGDDFAKLGAQAMAHIIKAGDEYQNSLGPSNFDAWEDLVSNFPGFVNQLSRTSAPGSVMAAIRKLRLKLVERAIAITVDGSVFSQDSSVLLPTVLRPLAAKLLGVEMASRVGLATADALKIMTYVDDSTSDEEAPYEGGRFLLDSLPCRLDWRSEGSSTISLPYIYDVLNSEATRAWSKNPEGLLMSIVTGHAEVVRLRARLFHFIVVFDPLNAAQRNSAIDFFDTTKGPAIVHLIPYISLRDGGDLAVDDTRALITEIFFRLISLNNKKKFSDNAALAIQFLKSLSEMAFNDSSSVQKLKSVYNKILHSSDESTKSLKFASEAAEFVKQKGLAPNTIVMNGRLMRLRASSESVIISYNGAEHNRRFDEIMSMIVLQEQKHLGTRLMFGGLVDANELAESLLSLRGSTPTCLLPEIVFTTANVVRLDICEFIAINEEDLRMITKPLSQIQLGNSMQKNLFATTEMLMQPNYIEKIPILFSVGQNDLKALDIAMAPAFDTEGLACVLSVLRFLQMSLERKTYFHIVFPEESSSQIIRLLPRDDAPIWRVISAVTSLRENRLPNLQLLIDLVVSIKHEVKFYVDVNHIIEKVQTSCAANFAEVICDGINSALDRKIPPLLNYDSADIDLPVGQIIVNSRRLPTPQSAYELSFTELRILAPIKMMSSLSSKISPLALHYALAIRESVVAHDIWDVPKDVYENTPAMLRMSLPPPSNKIPPSATIYGILDPLSRRTQSWLPILNVLNKVLNVEIKLVLNPSLSTTEYPVNRWYRHVSQLDDRMDFSQIIHKPLVLRFADYETSGTSAIFNRVRTRHTLTVGIDAPDSWLVRASETIHDLDNILPGQNVKAEFLLTDIFIEGQASNAYNTEQNLAGLQLEMFSEPYCHLRNGENTVYDTLVMGNLGYFQLRGFPGVFWVKAIGHAQDSGSEYVTSSSERLLNEHGDFGTLVVVNSLTPEATRLQIARSGAKIRRKLGWNSIMDAFNRWLKVRRSSACSQTIHIFSLASGHMYERLLRIMILSVRKNTDCPLTFWFIDNFLSPKFKEIMPVMAARYGILYNYVTYNWPSWLIRQTEKQRQIWAYKILFLDVLFPKSLSRVIYIDADQIVRADVRDLWEVDLQGRVYGFVPFCDTNPDTESFRFWKSGYWMRHLAGKPYHISALFVLDLQKYREMGAGDSLRAVYNALSRDKNSLANLDQDLPNFAQHEIPIFSLSQEWLWCETWCSAASQSAAKTIDLCNNPLTKEPKLSQARRIAPEWEGYDQVSSSFTGLPSQEIRDLEISVDTRVSQQINNSRSKDEL